MAIKLSVNVNKIALLRNARGGSVPDVLRMSLDAIRFGADGITVHPRPDQRHIRYSDLPVLKANLPEQAELNVEGNPTEPAFVEWVCKIKPAQVTLVPDAPGQLTSNHGWDAKTNGQQLSHYVALFRKEGIRVSVFVDPLPEQVQAAAACGPQRVELYTEAYAAHYPINPGLAIAAYKQAATAAASAGLSLNAGHDLNLQNLNYFAQNIQGLQEVSIGHALVADALYFGWENTIRMYQRALNP